MLILETPNPLSVVVAARNFWLDPTHIRPVHPESLKLMYELAGFDPVERLDLRPFPDSQRLPEIDLATLPPEQRPLADLVNRLRDRLDEVLFGYQDFGMVGRKRSPTQLAPHPPAKAEVGRRLCGATCGRPVMSLRRRRLRRGLLRPRGGGRFGGAWAEVPAVVLFGMFSPSFGM